MIKRLLMRIYKKINEPKRRKEKREQLIKSGFYIVSEKANPDNILIDTCAIKNKKGLDVIDASEKVSILYAVIEEMDKKKADINGKKNRRQEEQNFICNISKYSMQMLENPKYNLIPYRNTNNEYVDNIILRYLESKSKRKRPTLLTADKLFAVKAKCLGFEYILITGKQEKKTKKETQKTETQKSDKTKLPETKTPEKKVTKKINVVGIVISYIENNITIKRFCRDSIIFLVKADECKEIKLNTENIDVNSFDYIVAIKYMTKYKMVRISKISIEKEDIIQDVNDCKFVNEIYKLPIHETVLEQAKNLLAKV